MTKSIHRAVGFAILAIALGFAASADAAPPPSLQGPIATVGTSRRVDEADIRRAALVLAGDPLRATQPKAWRKKLLDLCVDRELLSLEAERSGLADERDLKLEIQLESAHLVFREISSRWLLPALEPTQSDVDTARAGGGFRRFQLHYILTVAGAPTALSVVSSLRHGASFDTLARELSLHPSALSGGAIGWRLARSMHPASWSALKNAKPGDCLGPYANTQAFEIYRVDSIAEPAGTDIRRQLVEDRFPMMEPRYHEHLLKKYGFAMNPEQVNPFIFATASEPLDSILASLGPDGTREERGIKPALGIIARVEGDSLSFADIAAPNLTPRRPRGKLRIHNTEELATICAAAIIPRLMIRDARERGLERDPEVARRLKLIQDEIAARAMVERAVAVEVDSAACRKYYDAHREQYQRSSVRRALVAMFASEARARSALLAWNGVGLDTVALAAENLRPQPRAAAATLLAGWYAEMPLYETDADPLSSAARPLDAGQFAPVVETAHGYAVAMILGREAPRPLTYQEAAARAREDLRSERENAWVLRQLGRLRAATPVQRFSSRLEAVRLGGTPTTGGKRR